MRLSHLPLAFLFLSACATAPAIVPTGGAMQATANAGPASLTVWASPWEAQPDDLTDYVTPVAVALADLGPNEVRVSFIDFQLTDERGFRYAALNPFVPAMAEADEPRGTLVAGRHMFVPAPSPGRMRPVWRGGGSTVHARPGVPWGATLPVPPRWRGYAPLPYYSAWYGLGIGYWGAPYWAVPGYDTWVWGWSAGVYPEPQPPLDVMYLALPEGVLSPGGQVDGYLYFQRTRPEARRLFLTWEAHDARTGALLGTARIPLDRKQ